MKNVPFFMISILALSSFAPGRGQSPVLLKDIRSGSAGSNPGDFVDVSGITYFTADDGKHGRELWRTDGTASGTFMVKDINPGKGTGADLSSSRIEYWRKDGSWRPAALGGTLFFQGFTPSSGWEIWKTDGTPAGTAMVKDILPGGASGGFYNGCVLGKEVFFFAKDPSGYSLWKTDGTAGGTKKLAGGFDFYWLYPYPYRGRIYFGGRTGAAGLEPWITDGTPGGTRLLRDIVSGNGWGYFEGPVGLGPKVFFKAMDPSNSVPAAWETDGTIAGTRVLFSSRHQSGDGMTVMGRFLFFLAFDNNYGHEPYISDGTRAGTRLLKDIYTGLAGSMFFYPCVAGRTLFFQARDVSHGLELWKTDGTSKGTVLVKDFRKGIASGYPSFISAVGTRRVVFQVDGGGKGTEPWISDGTQGGTRILRDIFPGGDGAHPNQFLLAGGRLVFRADDGAHGMEPWVWFPGATAKSFGFGSGGRFALSATDPALGGTMEMDVSGLGSSQNGLVLLAGPSHSPTALGPGWIYFDAAKIFGAFLVSSQSGGTLRLSIPSNSALSGYSLTAQAFIFPTKTPPLGGDLTNGVHLTFGK